MFDAPVFLSRYGGGQWYKPMNKLLTWMNPSTHVFFVATRCLFEQLALLPLLPVNTLRAESVLAYLLIFPSFTLHSA